MVLHLKNFGRSMQPKSMMQQVEANQNVLLVIGYLKEHCKKFKLQHLESQSDIIHLICIFNNDINPTQNDNEPQPASSIITPPPQPMDIVTKSTSSNAQNLNISIEPTELLIDGYIRKEIIIKLKSINHNVNRNSHQHSTILSKNERHLIYMEHHR